MALPCLVCQQPALPVSNYCHRHGWSAAQDDHEESRSTFKAMPWWWKIHSWWVDTWTDKT